MLGSTERPLFEAYDLAMLDLDGVVYVGGDAVPDAPEHLERVRKAGMRLAFITNNAARPPARVAEHLRELGVDAAPEDVVTSAQAAARVLAERLGAGARVVLLGAEGLREALEQQGLVPVRVSDEDAVAVVSGYGPDIRWRDIMRAAVRIRDGLLWVASNTDRSIPTAYGVAPGHGVLVDTIRELQRGGAGGRRQAGAAVARRDRPAGRRGAPADGGRPARHRHRGRPQCRAGLVAGADRCDRPRRAGRRRGRSSDRRTSPPTSRGLLEAHRPPQDEDGAVVLGGWRASVESGRLVVSGDGDAGDRWRVCAVAGVAHLDESGEPADIDGVASGHD